MTTPRLPDVTSQYGAPMGRREHHTKPTARTILLFRVPINRQGYDQGGAYWGIGQPLYRAQDTETDYQEFIRAHSRQDAAEQLKITSLLRRGTAATRPTPGGLIQRARCYDNANTPHATADHYTIITERAPFYCIFSSSNPTHPQGVWSAEETPNGPADREESGRFGRRIPCSLLPDAVRRAVNAYLTP